MTAQTAEFFHPSKQAGSAAAKNARPGNRWPAETLFPQATQPFSCPSEPGARMECGSGWCRSAARRWTNRWGHGFRRLPAPREDHQFHAVPAGGTTCPVRKDRRKPNSLCLLADDEWAARVFSPSAERCGFHGGGIKRFRPKIPACALSCERHLAPFPHPVHLPWAEYPSED